MVMATVPETEPIPSVKDLASSEPALRRKNLQQILSHLESRPASQYLSHSQALQLWRGFHVALYMHDSKNQLSVQTLIATLASTFQIIRRKDIEQLAVSEVSDVKTESTTSKKSTASTKTNGDENGDEFTGFDNDNDNNNSSSTEQAESTNQWLTTYSTAFWETMAREWSSLDQWRINKFLLLVRFALREILTISAQSYFGVEEHIEPSTTNDQNEPQQDQTSKKSSKKRKNVPEEPQQSSSKSTSSKKSKKTSSSSATTAQPIPSPSKPQAQKSTATALLQTLTSIPLSPRDRKTPDGLRLHILDIYLDELFRAAETLTLKSQSSSQDIDGPEQKEELKEALGSLFMGPVREIARDGLSRVVRNRAKDVIGEFEERVGEF